MKSKIANALLTTFGILLLICSIIFTVFAYVGQVPFLPAKNIIVANAQVINGIDYPQPNVSDFILIVSDEFGRMDYVGHIHEFSVDLIPYLQYNSILYLSVTHDYDLPPLTGYAHAVNNGMVSLNGNIFPILCTFALTANTLDFDQWVYEGYIYYDSVNESYWLHFQDDPGTFSTSPLFFDLYSVPTNNTESTTTESLTDILGNSINFSTSAITTSVKEVFEGLFVNENNTISNYATYVVWFSGIAIALGFFKYILRFILTMGDKK